MTRPSTVAAVHQVNCWIPLLEHESVNVPALFPVISMNARISELLAGVNTGVSNKTASVPLFKLVRILTDNGLVAQTQLPPPATAGRLVTKAASLTPIIAASRELATMQSARNNSNVRARTID